MDKKLFIELQQELLTQQRLERAAPDLLAACKAVLKDEEESLGAYEYAISAKLRQQLVDAVAKAEGRV